MKWKPFLVMATPCGRAGMLAGMGAKNLAHLVIGAL